MFEVIEFQRNGISPYRKFLEKLKDVKGRAIIAIRIDRIRGGNFGDHRNDIGKGVSELRINFGPGYRVYYGMDGKKIVVLLLAGDKSSQQRDIKHAEENWKEYLNAKSQNQHGSL